MKTILLPCLAALATSVADLPELVLPQGFTLKP
jgi:hypothetical protein